MNNKLLQILLYISDVLFGTWIIFVQFILEYETKHVALLHTSLMYMRVPYFLRVKNKICTYEIHGGRFDKAAAIPDFRPFGNRYGQSLHRPVARNGI